MKRHIEELQETLELAHKSEDLKHKAHIELLEAMETKSRDFEHLKAQALKIRAVLYSTKASMDVKAQVEEARFFAGNEIEDEGED